MCSVHQHMAHIADTWMDGCMHIGLAGWMAEYMQLELLPIKTMVEELFSLSLAVRRGEAGSHAKSKGWEKLTDAIICAVSRRPQRVVFLLWGKHAQVCTRVYQGHRMHGCQLQCAHSRVLGFLAAECAQIWVECGGEPAPPLLVFIHFCLVSSRLCCMQPLCPPLLQPLSSWASAPVS